MFFPTTPNTQVFLLTISFISTPFGQFTNHIFIRRLKQCLNSKFTEAHQSNIIWWCTNLPRKIHFPLIALLPVNPKCSKGPFQKLERFLPCTQFAAAPSVTWWGNYVNTDHLHLLRTKGSSPNCSNPYDFLSLSVVWEK